MSGVLPENITLNEDLVERHADGTVTLTLNFPVDVTYKGPDGDRTEKLETLTFRRMTTEDMEKQEQADGSMASVKLMFTRLTGIDPKTFGKLDAVDMLNGAVIIAGFTDPSQLTGGRS